MKELTLTNSKKMAIVDDKDYIKVVGFKWYLSSRGYVMRGQYLGNRRMKPVSLHSHILDCPKGMVRDHIDNNRLNNRRSNLRVTTTRLNVCNSPVWSKLKSSVFKGVSWHKAARKWHVGIKVNRKRLYLGLFEDQTKAAYAYNQAALLHFGEHAWLNPV